MQVYEIKRIYEKSVSEATLEGYRSVLEEHPESGEELAFIAADFAHPEALTLLFEAGVSPSVTDDYGFTLLHYLARHPESEYYIKPEGAVRRTAELLLDNKVSALRKDENERMTCYHYAARNGMAELVETLAGRGVKLDMTDQNGNTGVHIAAEYVKHAIDRIAYKKDGVVRAKKDYDETVVRLKNRDMTDEEIARYMTNNTDRTPEQAELEYQSAIALVDGYFRVVKAFAEGGVDINEKNEYGKSALDIAVKSEGKKIAAFLSGTLTEDEGAAAIAAGGMTLHQAAEKGDAEAIKALAATGMNLNALKDWDERGLSGCTALAVACAFLKADAVETLLACGADPSFKDGNGCAAPSYLVSGLKAILSSRVFDEKIIPKIIKALLGAGMSINLTINDKEDTLLTLACGADRGTGYNNHSLKGDILDTVLRLNPDVNHANRFGGTALMHACARDFDMMEKIQLDLLERGASVGAADQNGDTAMHFAARNDSKTGAKALCDMLLAFGADASAVNNAKQTALDIATERDNEPLVKLLLSKMCFEERGL